MGTRATLALLVSGMLLAGCGSAKTPSDGIPRLDFAYDAKAPLAYTDRGRINGTSYPIAIHDISFASGGAVVDAYLLVPAGSGRRPAVIFVHGSGGDRGELLAQAAWLAARNVVTLAITVPSNAVTSSPTTMAALLAQAQALTTGDVVAVRRAVDLLQTLPSVDPKRIGYIGWSAGARLGTFVAASEPRVKALVLLSAGAAKLSEFISNAPVATRPQVKQVLGSVDPNRYIAWARPGSVLLEDGRKDSIVPRSGLLNIAQAAPKGTELRWYDTEHQLNNKAYGDAFDWFARKLPINGPRIKGAATETTR